MLNDNMNEEMVEAAFELERAAKKYRKLYEEHHQKQPVIILRRDETGEGIFIADSFNTEIISHNFVFINER